jgi:hypothetical protein
MTAGWVCGRCAHSRPSCPAHKQTRCVFQGCEQQRGTHYVAIQQHTCASQRVHRHSSQTHEWPLNAKCKEPGLAPGAGCTVRCSKRIDTHSQPAAVRHCADILLRPYLQHDMLSSMRSFSMSLAVAETCRHWPMACRTAVPACLCCFSSSSSSGSSTGFSASSMLTSSRSDASRAMGNATADCNNGG